MYNLRYHIASLVAVFLSLSIGLLLGTIVVERGILDRQKETIVQSLQEEFRTLDAANTELRERTASREGLINELLPASIEGRLEGRHVLVMAGVGRVDGMSAVSEGIRSAGGVPVVMIVSSSDFGLDDPAVSAVVTGTVEVLGEESLYDAVVAGLVSEWSMPVEARAITARLQEAGVLRIDGEIEPGTPVEAVVTLASVDGSPESGALALAVGLAETGLPALGAEASSQSTGVVSAAVGFGLSGVDHISTPEGTYSLISVLEGTSAGYFGLGSDATAQWPSTR